MITFETEIRIERSLEEVFAFVSEPLNLPRWNSAVQAVRRSPAGEDPLHSTYSMERELPAGRAINRLEVVASRAPDEFAIRATDGPTPFRYRYRFSSQNGDTVLRLAGEVELPRAATVIPLLARHAVKSGVDHNLETLKRLLEARDGSRRPDSNRGPLHYE